MERDLLSVLVAVAEAGSLSAAARHLGIPAMTATRRLAALEAELGARLAHRTTRALSLTPAGQDFLPHARAMLDAETTARAALHPDARAEGLLRVTSSIPFGRKRLLPLLPGLLAANPSLRIDLVMRDRIVDLVAEGIDLAIRLGPLRDNNLVARRLVTDTRLLCASPAYLARHGRPRRLDELAAHDCLTERSPEQWRFRTAEGTRRITVSGRVSASSIDILEAACLAGLGLRMFASWNVGPLVEAGALVAIALDDAEPEQLEIWAVQPGGAVVPRRVRVLVAALEAALR